MCNRECFREYIRWSHSSSTLFWRIRYGIDSLAVSWDFIKKWDLLYFWGFMESISGKNLDYGEKLCEYLIYLYLRNIIMIHPTSDGSTKFWTKETLSIYCGGNLKPTLKRGRKILNFQPFFFNTYSILKSWNWMPLLHSPNVASNQFYFNGFNYIVLFEMIFFFFLTMISLKQVIGRIFWLSSWLLSHFSVSCFYSKVCGISW